MKRKDVIADLHEARDLVAEVPLRWTPKFLTQRRRGKARKILAALLNDPTLNSEIKASIRSALTAESRHGTRTELAAAIFKVTAAYLMELR